MQGPFRVLLAPEPQGVPPCLWWPAVAWCTAVVSPGHVPKSPAASGAAPWALTRVEAHHQVGACGHLGLHLPFPEVVVQPLEAAEINPSLRPRRGQGGPHDGPVHHVHPHHHHLHAPLPREHPRQLVVVGHPGVEGLHVGRPHHVDGEGLGEGVDAEEPQPQADGERPRVEVGDEAADGLAQLSLLRPGFPRVGPEEAHVAPGQDSSQLLLQLPLHGKPVLPARHLPGGFCPGLRGEGNVTWGQKSGFSGVALQARLPVPTPASCRGWHCQPWVSRAGRRDPTCSGDGLWGGSSAPRPTCEDEPLHQPVQGHQLQLLAELLVQRPVGTLARHAAVVHVLAPGGREAVCPALGVAGSVPPPASPPELALLGAQEPSPTPPPLYLLHRRRLLGSGRASGSFLHSAQNLNVSSIFWNMSK